MSRRRQCVPVARYFAVVVILGCSVAGATANRYDYLRRSYPGAIGSWAGSIEKVALDVRGGSVYLFGENRGVKLQLTDLSENGNVVSLRLGCNGTSAPGRVQLAETLPNPNNQSSQRIILCSTSCVKECTELSLPALDKPAWLSFPDTDEAVQQGLSAASFFHRYGQAHGEPIFVVGLAKYSEKKVAAFRAATRFNNWNFQNGENLYYARLETNFRGSFLMSDFPTWVYFLLDQQQVGASSTRLVRFCTGDNDAVLPSQVEIPLTCEDNEGELPRLTAAAALDEYEGEPVIVGAFQSQDGARSAICVYRFANINKKMGDAVCDCVQDGESDKDRLESPKTQVCDSFFSCVEGDKERRCPPNPVVGRATRSVLRQTATATMDGFTAVSIAVTQTSRAEYVAVLGGSDGSVGQVWLKRGRVTTVFTRDRVLSGRPVESAHALPQTPGAVLLHTSDSVALFEVGEVNARCEEYTDCGGCAGTSNPYCGWCVYDARCTMKDKCSSATSSDKYWVRDPDNCPAVQDNSVQRPLRDIHAEDVIFTVDEVPADPADNLQKLVCSLMGSLEAQEPAQVVWQASEQLKVTCTLKHSRELNETVQRSGNATTPVTIGWPREGRLVPLVTAEITVYDCGGAVTSCSQCAGTFFQCRWNNDASRCQYSSTCSGDCLYEAANCPRVTTSGAGITVVPAASNPRTVSVSGENFKPGNYLCRYTFSSTPVTFQANYVSRTEVQCRDVQLRLGAGVGKVDAQLELLWNQHTLDGQTQVGVYSCEALGPDCSTCGSLRYRVAEFWEEDLGCLWCGNGCTHGACSRPVECAPPSLTSVSPVAGPKGGGTVVTVAGSELGAQETDVAITVAGVPCRVLNGSFVVGESIKCRADSGRGRTKGPVSVTVNGKITSGLEYTFKDFSVTDIEPKVGPIAGGTRVTVKGTNLDIGGATVVTFIGSSGPPVLCNTIESVNRTPESLECVTQWSAGPARNLTAVRLAIDDDSREFSVPFRVASNPSVSDILPGNTRSYFSGGKKLTVVGTSFTSVQKPLLYVDTATPTDPEPCEVVSDTGLLCYTPSLNDEDRVRRRRAAGSVKQRTLRLVMDNVTIHQMNVINAGLIVATKDMNVQYYPDPTFQPFEGGTRNVPGDGLLEIEGAGWDAIQSRKEVQVDVGAAGTCNITSLDNSKAKLICRLPPLDEGSKHEIRVLVGRYVKQRLGEIELHRETSLRWEIILGGSLAAVFVFVLVVVIVCCVQRRRISARDREYHKVQIQLDTLESNVRNECKLAFAELQTDMTDLTGDVEFQRIPYLEYKAYMSKVLFPGQSDHPCLVRSVASSYRSGRAEAAMGQFQELLFNKTFAVCFIRGLEEQRSFSIRDKSNVASLLTVVFQRRMDYLTELLRMLINDLVAHTVEKKKNHKLLFRRTEYVVEKLLTCWLSVCMYPQLHGDVGHSLYVMYLALKHLTEKGPVDMVTGDARYALSEDRLLREKIEPFVISVVVEHNGVTHYIRVLNTDTITQAKAKICEALYKHIPNTYRPSLDSLQLEWRHGHAGRLIMRDLDSTSTSDGGWHRLNTLHHYNVPRSVTLALVPVDVPASPSTLKTSDVNVSFGGESESVWNVKELVSQGKVYHLVKPTEAHETHTQDKIISEIFLTRLLQTKGTLQEFIDKCYNTLLDTDRAVPSAVKWLFDVLENAARTNNVTDPEVLHTWKSNSMLLRFWVNIVKNPDFVLDVEPPPTVDSSLSVIAQTLMDACSTQMIRLGKDSPSNKLLFAKDLPRYRAQVQNYYQRISEMPPVEGPRLTNYLNRLSEDFSNPTGGNYADWNTINALLELHGYARKYHVEILEKVEDTPDLRHQNIAGRLEHVSQMLLHKPADMGTLPHS